jgi:DNA-binding TFAR19-related protein (PDSD5 family)
MVAEHIANGRNEDASRARRRLRKAVESTEDLFSIELQKSLVQVAHLDRVMAGINERTKLQLLSGMLNKTKALTKIKTSGLLTRASSMRASKGA